LGQFQLLATLASSYMAKQKRKGACHDWGGEKIFVSPPGNKLGGGGRCGKRGPAPGQAVLGGGGSDTLQQVGPKTLGAWKTLPHDYKPPQGIPSSFAGGGLVPFTRAEHKKLLPRRPFWVERAMYVGTFLLNTSIFEKLEGGGGTRKMARPGAFRHFTSRFSSKSGSKSAKITILDHAWGLPGCPDDWSGFRSISRRIFCRPDGMTGREGELTSNY